MDETIENTPSLPDCPLQDLSTPCGFSSLLARIQTIYGKDVTVQEFLNISEDDFAAQRGIGHLYVTRFRQLQDHVLQQGIKPETAPIPLDTDLEAWEIPISNVPEEYLALYTKLQNLYGIQTYADIFRIDPEQFKELRGVGSKKYQQVLRWRTLLLNHPPKKVVLEDIQGYRLNFSCLSKSERALVNKFLRRGMCSTEITPSFLMKQSPIEICSAAGFGRKSAASLISFQQKIRGFFAELPELNRFLNTETYGQNLEMREIGQSLVKDIEDYACTLAGQEKDIFILRSGFGEEQLTLEELGCRFGVTRERIRQKEQGLFFDLLHSVRIPREVLTQKIEGLSISTIISEMADFRRAFSTDSACLRMLARLAGIDARELLQKAASSIPQSALDDFLCSAMPPVQRSDVLSFLGEEFNLEEEVAEEALVVLEKQNQLAVAGQTVSPRKAKKEVAVCHLLAMYPGGLDWGEIAQKVNDLGLCRTQLSVDRPDGVLHSSAYIFQSGRSQYSHLRYLELSKEDVRHWLADIKAALNQSEHKALHLRAEYYAQLTDPKPDYYKLRHVARNFGAQAGIYFHGRSKADTVSLDPDSKCISQLDALARVLEERPMAIDEIARHIHSQTEGHAWAYLGALISSGRVVRMDDDTYASPAIAFADIDADKALDVVRSTLAGDDRVHHMGVLTSQINRSIGLDLTPKSCRSLIVAYATREKWHVRGYLAASQPFKWAGLSEIVCEAPDICGEDLISWVQQRVCASRDVIKRAIYNSGTRLAGADDDDYSGGLASDLMQELFEL